MRVVAEQRGDTIIEVLFAITVFSLVAVGVISLINQGAAIAQQALEIGQVRQQMDAQTDVIRYLNSTYIDDFHKGGVASKLWQGVLDAHTVTSAQDYTTIQKPSGCNLPDQSGKAFTINYTKVKDAFADAVTSLPSALSELVLVPTSDTISYARLVTDPQPSAQGIWVQAVRKDATSNFYDFHIRACWQTPGQTIPMTLGTIVRLYVPHQ
jgi:type II secretory pathway pseudopilin PulG